MNGALARGLTKLIFALTFGAQLGIMVLVVRRPDPALGKVLVPVFLVVAFAVALLSRRKLEALAERIQPAPLDAPPEWVCVECGAPRAAREMLCDGCRRAPRQKVRRAPRAEHGKPACLSCEGALDDGADQDEFCYHCGERLGVPSA